MFRLPGRLCLSVKVVRGVVVMDDVRLKEWVAKGDYVYLAYWDNDVVTVRRSDFDLMFGLIVTSLKSVVVRDFAVKDGAKGDFASSNREK